MNGELLPCPFCGAGEYHIRETKHWTGVQNAVLSVSVQHWCDAQRDAFRSYHEVKRKTKEEAIAAWNTRV